MTNRDMKMRNFKLTIQYEGTRYQGWQRQDSTGNTIQGKLETIVAKMTGLDFADGWFRTHGCRRARAGAGGKF